MLASSRTDTLAHDALIAGPMPLLSEKKTLAAGTLARGAVLGRVAGTPVIAADAGNTGNGTIASATVGAGVKIGAYRVVCVEPATNGGVFAVEDPDGNMVGRATVGAATTGQQLVFTIADGATDFAVGDSFTITVPDTGTVRHCIAAATDGSARPWGILAEDADAIGGAVECVAYTRGDFNEGALILGAGVTLAAIREPLRQRGIALLPVRAA